MFSHQPMLIDNKLSRMQSTSCFVFTDEDQLIELVVFSHQPMLIYNKLSCMQSTSCFVFTKNREKLVIFVCFYVKKLKDGIMTEICISVRNSQRSQCRVHVAGHLELLQGDAGAGHGRGIQGLLGRGLRGESGFGPIGLCNPPPLPNGNLLELVEGGPGHQWFGQTLQGRNISPRAILGHADGGLAGGEIHPH